MNSISLGKLLSLLIVNGFNEISLTYRIKELLFPKCLVITVCGTRLDIINGTEMMTIIKISDPDHVPRKLIKLLVSFLGRRRIGGYWIKEGPALTGFGDISPEIFQSAEGDGVINTITFSKSRPH